MRLSDLFFWIDEILANKKIENLALGSILTLALSGVWNYVNNASQDVVINELRTMSKNLWVEWKTFWEIFQQANQQISNSNSNLNKANQTIQDMNKIFNTKLLPQLKSSNADIQSILRLSRNELVRYDQLIQTNGQRIDKLNKILLDLKTKENNAQLTQQEKEKIKDSIFWLNINWASQQISKSFQEFLVWKPIELVAWESIAQIQSLVNSLQQMNESYKKSKLVFSDTITKFQNFSSNVEESVWSISDIFGSVNQQSLSIQNSSQAIWNANEQNQKFFTSSDIVKIAKKQELDTIINWLENLFKVLNWIALFWIFFSSAMLSWYNKKWIVDDKTLMITAQLLWWAWAVSPFVNDWIKLFEANYSNSWITQFIKDVNQINSWISNKVGQEIFNKFFSKQIQDYSTMMDK